MVVSQCVLILWCLDWQEAFGGVGLQQLWKWSVQGDLPEEGRIPSVRLSVWLQSGGCRQRPRVSGVFPPVWGVSVSSPLKHIVSSWLLFSWYASRGRNSSINVCCSVGYILDFIMLISAFRKSLTMQFVLNGIIYKVTDSNKKHSSLAKKSTYTDHLYCGRDIINDVNVILINSNCIVIHLLFF